MYFNVTIKQDAPADALEKAKEQARNTGGTIRHEYKLIKGFTVEYPDDHIVVLRTNEYMHVEQDGGVTKPKK